MTRHRYEQLASLLAALELDYWRLKAEPECCRGKCRTLYAARMVKVMSDVRTRLYQAARDGLDRACYCDDEPDYDPIAAYYGGDGGSLSFDEQCQAAGRYK